MAADEKPIPTVTLRLTNAEQFEIEIAWEGTTSLNLVRAMLSEGMEGLKKQIADLEAAEFGAKMNAAAAAHRAMQKGPLIRQ